MTHGSGNGRRHDGWYYTQLVWRMLKISFMRYYSSGGYFMAAAIAFYALICLAPLGILLATLLQRTLEAALISDVGYQRLETFVNELAGGATDQIMMLIGQLATRKHLASSGTLIANLASVGALVWGGLRLFDIVQLTLSTIWPGRRIRHFFLRKLISLAMMMVAGVVFVALIAIVSTRGAINEWLRQFQEAGSTWQINLNLPLLHSATTFVIGAIISMLAYLLLYKFMPVQRVNTKAAFVGATFAALIWQTISPVFTRFVALSAHVDPIFGGLGWVVIFGLWAFWGAQVLLFGAQVTAAYEHVIIERRPRGEDDTLIDTSRRRTQLYIGDLDAEAERIIEDLHLDREAAACELDAAGNKVVNGIILGGGRINHVFADMVGTDVKGLINIDGHASFEYVLAAMRSVPGMRKIVLVGDKAAYLNHPGAEQLDAIIDEGPDISHNLMRAIRFLNDDRRILLSTADIPLLTGEALCAFLAKCDLESDLCYPVTPRAPTRKLFGRRIWTFLPLKEGWITHTCNILFDPRLVLRNQDFVERFLSRRKDLWGAAGTVGIAFMIRFFLGWYLPFLRYDMPSIANHIALMTGAHRCQGIILDYPEIALDIDKPSDVEEIEDFITREKQQGRWRPELAPVEAE